MDDLERRREQKRLATERYRATPEGRERSRTAVRESMRRWRRTPEGHAKLTEARHARRAAMAAILLRVKVESDVCGICFEPLTDRLWPDPLSTTVGHEPPIAVAERQGWTIVAERPEHLACNQWKGSRTDAELAA